MVDSLFATLLKGARENLETYARDNGSEVICAPPPEFKAYVVSEIERYRRVLPRSVSRWTERARRDAALSRRLDVLG